MDIFVSKETLLSHDGLPLYSELHLHPKHKGIVILLHGYGDHCGRYKHVIDKLTQNQFSVYTFDQRAHGRSPGNRGYIDSLNNWINDLDMMMDRVIVRENNKPIYLIGQGTGALIAALYYTERKPDIRGLVMIAPLIKSCASRLSFYLAEILSMVAPHFPLMACYHDRPHTRDPQSMHVFLQDQLCYHGRIHAKTSSEILRGTMKLLQQLSSIDCPVLIMQGTADRTAYPEGAHLLYEKAVSQDKSIKIYENCYHDLFHEIERETILSDLVAWMALRSSKYGIAPSHSVHSNLKVALNRIA
jgi:alpha-beta hydrolase superfamily lysophospholipase